MPASKSAETKALCYALRREAPDFVVSHRFLWKVVADCTGVESRPGFYNKLDVMMEIHEAVTRIQEDRYQIHPVSVESSLETVEPSPS